MARTSIDIQQIKTFVKIYGYQKRVLDPSELEFFETGYHCVVLANLELTMYTSLASTPRDPSVSAFHVLG